MVFERSVAITTVAMADHVVIDLPNHGVHWRRKCHRPESPLTALCHFLAVACDARRSALAEVEFALPTEGIEPTLTCVNWILSPARLPIPPRRLL